MRKLLYKLKKLHKGIMFYLHRNMLAVKNNAVLIVIYIWRILKSPFVSLNFDRYNSMILSCRMIDSASIAFIFHTELTFGISTLLCIFCSSNCFGIFFWFRKINCDIHLAIRCLRFPLHISGNPITPDIICILAECIIPVCRCLRSLFLIKLSECKNHIRWTRHQSSHNLCVKQIPVNNTVI